MLTDIPAISKEYLLVPGITAFAATSPDAAVDPSTLPVYLALVTRGDTPGGSDWQSAEWADSATARLLLGPSGYEPGAGYWAVWVRITGTSEEPRRLVGYVTIV